MLTKLSTMGNRVIQESWRGSPFYTLRKEGSNADFQRVKIAKNLPCPDSGVSLGVTAGSLWGMPLYTLATLNPPATVNLNCCNKISKIESVLKNRKFVLKAGNSRSRHKQNKCPVRTHLLSDVRSRRREKQAPGKALIMFVRDVPSQASRSPNC